MGRFIAAFRHGVIHLHRSDTTASLVQVAQGRLDAGGRRASRRETEEEKWRYFNASDCSL
jgi:hypothetical protein